MLFAKHKEQRREGFPTNPYMILSGILITTKAKCIYRNAKKLICVFLYVLQTAAAFSTEGDLVPTSDLITGMAPKDYQV